MENSRLARGIWYEIQSVYENALVRLRLDTEDVAIKYNTVGVISAVDVKLADNRVSIEVGYTEDYLLDPKRHLRLLPIDQAEQLNDEVKRVRR